MGAWMGGGGGGMGRGGLLRKYDYMVWLIDSTMSR